MKFDSSLSTLNRDGKDKVASAALAVLACIFVVGLCDPAFAGTDTTFDTLNTKFSGYISGSGGELAAVLAFGFALAGSILKFNLQQMASAVGVGAMAGLGLPIITGGITALV